jgi:glycosyltransferase involved in cell wall biosynthesis
MREVHYPGTRTMAPRLRIVHAVRSDRFAGVESYVASVAHQLAVTGHEVTVIGGDPTRMREELVGTSVATWSASYSAGVALQLIRHARRADVVHVHMTAAEAAMMLARPWVRAPVLATRHFAATRGTSIVGRAAAHPIGRMLTTQLSISRFVAESAGEPTELLVGGVADAELVDPVGKVVLVAQRLEPEKHTAEAIEAWVASGLSQDGWELWIAGAGSERTRLEETATSAEESGVRFLGQRNDLAELRQHVGMLLAPPRAEPFGLGVAEAMASGLPVVAAGAGGHLETVGAARPDLLYPPGDTTACASLLRRLAGSVSFRREVGTQLRSFQQKQMRLDRHVEGLVAIYRRATIGAAPSAATPRGRNEEP